MSSRKRAHQLVDQVADQAEALVEHVTPHVEAARDRVVSEYVPQARAALDDARESIATAAMAAAAKAPVGPKPKKKRRGRMVLRLLVLAGVGTAIGTRLRNRNLSGSSMYEAPEPAAAVPPQPDPLVETDPVPPGAVGEHNPAPEDLARLEDEAPMTPDAPAPEAPEDSLNSFFDEMMNETGKGSRRR